MHPRNTTRAPLRVSPLLWFMAGLCVATALTLPVFWLDSLFPRPRQEFGLRTFNLWTAPLLWLLGAGVAAGLWRIGLWRFAMGVGVGTLAIGLLLL